MATPDEPLRTRLGIAARVAAALLAGSGDRPLAIGIVGSTALGRCDAASDLDLVAIVRDPPARTVTTAHHGDVRVDVEWLTAADAAHDAGRGGWTWELRKAARLGLAISLHDPGGLFDALARRAAGAAPDRRTYAEHLDAADAILDTLSPGIEPGDVARFRGTLDALAMLRLLTMPRRYQKAKWVLDDLIDQGETPLAGAIIDAHGIAAGSAAPAVAAARRSVEAALRRAGEPGVDALVRMGHAPDHAAASYAARTLADAEDRLRGGAGPAAHYTASFAVRLAQALPARRQGTIGAEEALAGGGITPRALAAARDAAARCRAWLDDRALAPA